MQKRILTTILSLLIFLCTSVISVRTPFLSSEKRTTRADEPSFGSYACILYENTFFYSEPNESKGIFLLPVTYYVKLIEYGVEYCRTEYLYDDTQVKKLTGYVKTELLTFVDYLPKRPYFFHVFDLSYRIDENVVEDPDFLDEITVSCAYYGDYKIGSKTYCYVLRDDSFGYVPKPLGLTVRENTEYAEYLASLTPVESAGSVSTTRGDSSPAQIAILVALCLLVPVLAALILKPPRRPPYETE